MKQLLDKKYCVPFEGYTGEIENIFLDFNKEYRYYVYVYEQKAENITNYTNYNIFNSLKEAKDYIREKIGNRPNFRAEYAKYHKDDGYVPREIWHLTMKNNRLYSECLSK